MSSLIQLAEDEERRLLKELRTVPSFQKLEAVRAMLSAYRNTNAGSFQGADAQKDHYTVRGETKGAAQVNAAVNFLRQRKSRASARDIMAAITPEGTVVEQNAINSFASALSHSPLLDNVRREGGYGLVEWHTPAEPVVEANPLKEDLADDTT